MYLKFLPLFNKNSFLADLKKLSIVLSSTCASGFIIKAYFVLTCDNPRLLALP